MKNRVLLISLAVVLVVSLVTFAACTAEEEELSEWPDKMLILSVGAYGSSYAATVAWTAELQRDTGMAVRIVSEENETNRFRYMKQGLFFLTVDRYNDTIIRAQGEGYGDRDGGPWQQRIIWPCGKVDQGYVVRGDSDIKTPYDLKGKRVIYFMWGQAAKDIMLAALAWGNVREDEVTWVPASGIEASEQMIVEGKADVTFAFCNTPVWLEAEATPHGIKWMELNSQIDPEGAERYLEIRPGNLFGPATTGAPSVLGVHTVYTFAVNATRADTDAGLVYKTVKWLDENYDKYKDAHPYCATMTLDLVMDMAEKDFIPLHDGTVRYLEEKGLWTEAHEARRQQNIDLYTKWMDAYQTAIDAADEKGMRVAADNEEWVQYWMDYSAGLNYPKFQFFPDGLD